MNFNAGVEAKRNSYIYNPDMYSTSIMKTNVNHFPDTTVEVVNSGQTMMDTTSINAAGVIVDGFLQQRMRFTDQFRLTLGVRYDYFSLAKEGRYSLRANLFYSTPPGIDLIASWGIYYQLPTYNQLKMSEPSANNTQMQKATQYFVGFKKIMSDRFDF